MSNRRKNDLSDKMKVLFLGVLISTSFLAGVLTANYQTRQIIDETKDISTQVKLDLEKQIQQDRAEQDEHRLRDALHVCMAALDHLDVALDLRNIAEQVGLDVAGIPTRLRPEVIKICEDTRLKSESYRH